MRNYWWVALLGLAVPAVGCAREAGVPARAQSKPINWFRADGRINWEAEKQQRHIPTTTIVIHHTAMTKPASWQQLSEIGRGRVYVPRFRSTNPEPYVQGRPVESGHYRTGAVARARCSTPTTGWFGAME